MSPHRVVVGVDGSAAGRRALDWALEHAAEREVLVLTAFEGVGATDLPHPRSDARRHHAAVRQRDTLAAALAEHSVESTITCKVLPGPAARVLTDNARDSDLLVIGSHGHGPIETRLLGTISSECIRLARCPVLVIPATPGEQG